MANATFHCAMFFFQKELPWVDFVWRRESLLSKILHKETGPFNLVSVHDQNQVARFAPFRSSHNVFEWALKLHTVMSQVESALKAVLHLALAHWMVALQLLAQKVANVKCIFVADHIVNRLIAKGQHCSRLKCEGYSVSPGHFYLCVTNSENHAREFFRYRQPEARYRWIP